MNREDFPLIAGAASEMADCCMGKDIGLQGVPEGLVYLDNAATMQKPRKVLDAVYQYYKTSNANPLRGLYDLSVAATAQVVEVRVKVADFIGAEAASEIIFTSGTTEGLNTAAMWCAGLSSDDEIIISRGEHHSNFLPWVRIAEATGAHLRVVDVNADGTVKEGDFSRALTPNTKVVALNYIGNVYGGENCIKNLFSLAHERASGVMCVLDAAQAVAHQKVDVVDLGADVAAFSGHKMGAPMGIGVLYAKRSILERVMPLKLGGEMVNSVEMRENGIMTELAEIPQRYEAGTLNVGGIVGLGAAIDYLNKIGIEEISKYEQELTDYALLELGKVAEVYGGGRGIIAFNVPGVHPHDVAQVLNTEGIAVRAGWHCAQPLLEFLEVGPVVRASLSFYNTRDEIDKLARVLKTVPEKMWVKNV